MLERVENKWGKIDIERPAAAKVIKEAVMASPEIFGIANSKGNTASFAARLAFDKNSDYIQIDKDRDGGIVIRINLILYFGESISEVTQTVISRIRRDLKDHLNIEPMEIMLHVTGLKTRKRNGKVLARDIVVRG